MSLDFRTARAALLGIAAALSTSQVDAAPVSIWRTFKASPATVIAGQGTNSPTIGATDASATATRIIGYFTPQTLVNVGDKLSLTFTVSFNDAVGVTNSGSGDNFRFALFDLNGENVPAAENVASNGSADTNNFLGYWAGVMTGMGQGAAGSLRKRTVTSNNDMFANTTAPGSLTSPPITGTNVAFTGLVNGEGTETLYAGELTITRTLAGVDVSGGFSGNGGSNVFTASDATPVSLTYGAVGFLNAGGISADQVIFQNVDVTFTAIPEPSSIALLGLACGITGLAARRHRSKASLSRRDGAIA